MPAPLWSYDLVVSSPPPTGQRFRPRGAGLCNARRKTGHHTALSPTTCPARPSAAGTGCAGFVGFHVPRSGRSAQVAGRGISSPGSKSALYTFSKWLPVTSTGARWNVHRAPGCKRRRRPKCPRLQTHDSRLAGAAAKGLAHQSQNAAGPSPRCRRGEIHASCVASSGDRGGVAVEWLVSGVCQALGSSLAALWAMRGPIRGSGDPDMGGRRPSA